MNLQRLRIYCAENWKPLSVYAAMFAVLFGGLYFRLGSLVGGYSTGESLAYRFSLHLHNILQPRGILFAPFGVLVKAVSLVVPHNLIAGRLASTIIGAITLVLFAALVTYWHGIRTAVLSTILFGFSASFLHVSRLGIAEALLFGLFVLAVCGFWLKRTNHWAALLACFLLVGVLAYVPGMIWFVLIGLVWQWKTIDRIFKKNLLAVTLGTILLLAMLTPLGWELYKSHGLIRPLLGLPAQLPGMTTIAKNLLNVPVHLFVHNSADPTRWLGTAPILDVFSLAMFILGGYLYARHIRLIRTPLFLSLFIVTAGLIAIGDAVTLTVIMPFVYVVIAAGIAYLLDKWLAVFPRNPIARGLGWTFVSILVGLACLYQITHYFIGWPESAATNAVFTVQKTEF